MPKHDPVELERQWREALAGVAGQEYADISDFLYVDGWYYLRTACRLPNGGYYLPLPTMNERGIRARQVLEEIEHLKKRTKGE